MTIRQNMFGCKIWTVTIETNETVIHYDLNNMDELRDFRGIAGELLDDIDYAIDANQEPDDERGEK